MVIITHFACCLLGNEEHVPLYGHPCLLHDVYSFSVLLNFFVKRRQEVVGEIYDEDDNEEYAVDSRDISR